MNSHASPLFIILVLLNGMKVKWIKVKIIHSIFSAITLNNQPQSAESGYSSMCYMNVNVHACPM